MRSPFERWTIVLRWVSGRRPAPRKHTRAAWTAPALTHARRVRGRGSEGGEGPPIFSTWRRASSLMDLHWVMGGPGSTRSVTRAPGETLEAVGGVQVEPLDGGVSQPAARITYRIASPTKTASRRSPSPSCRGRDARRARSASAPVSGKSTCGSPTRHRLSGRAAAAERVISNGRRPSSPVFAEPLL